jgi:hypothetical protein
MSSSHTLQQLCDPDSLIYENSSSEQLLHNLLETLKKPNNLWNEELSLYIKLNKLSKEAMIDTVRSKINNVIIIRI